MSFQIASLNVNGLRDKSKRLKLFHFFETKLYDIIFLQETHCSNQNESLVWSRQWNGKSIWNNGSSQSKGVAILFKSHLDVELNNVHTDDEGRVISGSARLNACNENAYQLTNIYAPNIGNERKKFLKSITSMLHKKDTSTHIIGGDFNCVSKYDLDRKSNQRSAKDKHDEGETELLNLQNTLTLEDVWRRRNPNSKTFTFSRANSKSRIDYFLCSKRIDNEIEQAKIVSCVFSDHDIIYLKLNTSKIERGPGLWMFNSELIKKQNYIHLIEKYWQSWRKRKHEFSSLSEWWEMAKHNIKILTIDFSRENHRSSININKLELELSALKQLPDSYETSNEIKVLESKISEYYNSKYNAYKLRSKSENIGENEKSSKYFFNLEKQRGKNKLWSKLKTENGETIYGIKSILNEQKRFYEELFTSEGCDENQAKLLLTNIETCLTENEKQELEYEITNEELDSAVKSFKLGKSPGEDGLTVEWYQKFWYLIRTDFSELVFEILESGKLPNSQYRGVISLLYKSGERELLKNWRPITLLNIDYKIISKCLSRRLKSILPNIIHTDQKGFVQGRYINEANRHIQDVISYVDDNDEEGLVIFLDQTKAFDRVEWQWIEMCLEKFNFGIKFRTWIQMLLKGSKTCIKTNGFLSDFFSLSRSIKQGCPVAPLLYIIQAEAMAASIRKDENIQGIKLPSPVNTSLETRLSQFDDDTQFFCKNEDSLPHIFRNLKRYEEASGARVNKSKTTGLLIGRLKGRPHTCKEIKWTRDHVKTLGVHHGYNIDENVIWMEKINKIKSCLSVWKMRNLTYQGKVLIIKSFIISKILYEMETRGIPQKYIDLIEAIIKQFVWDNKQPLVCKSTIQLSKEEGGLSVPNINTLYKATNVKTVYRIINSECQNWNAIGKFYLKSSDKRFGINYFLCTCSSLSGIKFRYKTNKFYKTVLNDWLSFRKTVDSFQNEFKLNIHLFGNCKITFNKLPIFFESFTKSNILCLSDIWDTDRKTCISDKELYSKLTSKRNCLAEWAILKSAVADYQKSTDRNNTPKPKITLTKCNIFNTNGKLITHNELKLKDITQVFNVKTKRLACEDKWNTILNQSLNWTKIWQSLGKSKASLKAKQLHWKTLHHAIFTEHKLNLMGYASNVCKVCKQHSETINHLFWTCSHAQSIWKRILPILEAISINTLNCTIENMETTCLVGMQKTPTKSKLVNTIIMETKWYIWKSRNVIKYENKTIDKAHIFNAIKDAVIDQLQWQHEPDLRNEFQRTCTP